MSGTANRGADARALAQHLGLSGFASLAQSDRADAARAPEKPRATGRAADTLRLAAAIGLKGSFQCQSPPADRPTPRRRNVAVFAS